MDYNYSDLCTPPENLSEANSSGYAIPHIETVAKPMYHLCGTVLVDGGKKFGVSAAIVDKYEELIWMGNQGGHVTSYYGPEMKKYTSFQIHETEEVQDMVTADEGIYVLSKSTLRHQIRRGLPRYTFKSESMMNMKCLYQASTHKLLIGGHQNKLIYLDLEKVDSISIPIEEDGCTIFNGDGESLVACGSPGGEITIRDLRCLGTAEQTFRAHDAGISGLDIQGHLLITSGLAYAANGTVADSHVNVWDLRCIRTGKQSVAWTKPVISPPLLLRFIPTLSGQALTVSGDGHVELHYIDKPESKANALFQLDTKGSVCTVMDVSSTNQALIFGDQSGHLSMFSPQHITEPVFNINSRKTVFADKVTGIPRVRFNDSSFCSTSVRLPPLTTGTKWFNHLPEQFYRNNSILRRPKPMNQESLNNTNHKTVEKNQTKETTSSIPTNSTSIRPNLRRMQTVYNSIEEFRKDTNELAAVSVEYYAMQQMLICTHSIKRTLLEHTCSDPPNCLSCELAFLIKIFDPSCDTSLQVSHEACSSSQRDKNNDQKKAQMRHDFIIFMKALLLSSLYKWVMLNLWLNPRI